MQALATQAMLTRRNYPAHLRIGAAKDEVGQLKAHAWVELGGKVIIGKAGVSQYTPLPRLEIIIQAKAQAKVKEKNVGL